MKKINAIAVLCIFVPVVAFAQMSTPRVDQREFRQEARIQQGVASGSLTRQEAMRLERGQQHVANMEVRAKSDGVVTNQERRRLHQAQEVQSRHISNQKHDRQHDYNHDGRRDMPRR
jgi:hypothetical protein